MVRISAGKAAWESLVSDRLLTERATTPQETPIAGDLLGVLSRRQDLYTLVDGLKVRYWDVGEGPAVLLLHGLGVTVETWLPTVEPLAAHYRVLAPDFPGFGLSAKTGFEFSVGYASRFVAAFLAAVGAPQASLAGNSMGGLVALQTALDFPDLVDRLVLVDSAGLGREVALSLRLLSLPLLGRLLLPSHLSESTVRQVAKYLLCNGDQVPTALIRRWTELGSLPGAAAAVWRAASAGLTILGQRRSIILLDRLNELRVPTLIVWGSADPVFPLAHAEAAHRRLPGSELRILAGCRHCPPLERPAEFNDALLAFLGRC